MFWVLLFLVLLIFGIGSFFVFICQVIAFRKYGFPAAHFKVRKPPEPPPMPPEMVDAVALGHTVEKIGTHLHLYCDGYAIACIPYDGNFSIHNCRYCGCQVETTGTGPKKRVAAFKREKQ